MKYYKTPKFAKVLTSTGFFTVIACALIAVGAIAWFTLSRKNDVTEIPSDQSSQQTYPNTDNSYNIDSETQPLVPDEPVADVNDSVSDVPYQENEENIPQEESPSFILPIENNISKGYSDTALQYSATYGDMRLHTGIDILCDNGSNIKSMGSGTVKTITEDANYGKIITIQYSNDISIKYCGMASVNVKENDKVATGDIIGTSGEIPSECADNPHIHIEVLLDGEITSPLSSLGLE